MVGNSTFYGALPMKFNRFTLRCLRAWGLKTLSASLSGSVTALGVTQKTAWFMLHRLRYALQRGTFDTPMGEDRRQTGCR